jgi:CDP-paratose 2-epimerase
MAEMGYKLNYTDNDTNRGGDHICYISDLTKIRAHYPNRRLARRAGPRDTKLGG